MHSHFHTPCQNLHGLFNCLIKVNISHSTKSFKVDIDNRTDTVRIDHLKPAHLDTDTALPIQPAREEPEVRGTRSGRYVHSPGRYMHA
jgi:hypothetical protein